MLNLAKVKERYTNIGRAFYDLIPWMIQVRPDMVLNKDGSLLVCYAFEGIDSESVQEIDRDRYTRLVEHGMRVFNDRITVWWTVDRRRTYTYTDGTFPDEISAGIDTEWRNIFMEGNQYVNKHYISILFSPESSVNGFMDRVGYFSTNFGYGLGKSFYEAARATLSKKMAFAFDSYKLQHDMKQFDEMLNAFDETIRDVGMVRIDNVDLLSFLHDRCSPANVGQPVIPPSPPAYLDGYLPTNTMYAGQDTLLFEDNENIYAAAVSVKDWPEVTMPGILDVLLAVPGEVTINQIFRFIDQGQAQKFIEGIRTHNINTQKTMFTRISEAMTNTESDKVNEGKARMAADASEALAEMKTHNRIYGYYNLSVLCYGRSSEEVEDTTKMVSQELRQRGYLIVREKLHLLSAWAGTLPGQWGEIVRWAFLSTANMADLCPIWARSAGVTENHYLTEQTGRRCPSLTTLSTEYSTPFYFNLHSGDLAHTMVVGPSRAGKSVFDNFLISQFRKYDPCRIFIFDKDYSCKVPTLLQNGHHIDMTGDGMVRLNPMLLLDDRDAWPWLINWLEILITSRGYKITSEDDTTIWKALESVHALPRHHWRLMSLVPALGKTLGDQLGVWVGDGQLAKYFDNEEDHFSVGDFTTTEIGGLFFNQRLAAAFLEYAFYRISRELDGRPTLIYLEEAWFMLSDERFTQRINDWLKTLAKKNAFLIMATQSLDELAKSDIFASIIDNIPNKIFLANSNAGAHYDMYTQKFGLNPEQVDRIRNAVPKMNYYIVTPRMSRMAMVSFPPNILACLRSDSRAQKVFSKHYEQREENENWKFDYIKELVG